MIDDHKNRKSYKAIFKQLGRNIHQDMDGIENSVVDLRMDKDLDYNQIVINDNVVATGSFKEFAILYHFLKKCIYR